MSKFEKYNRFKIQQKVADLLGIDAESDEEIDSENALVPVPEASEITLIDNPELPDLTQELLRLEHGLRQQEMILNRGNAALMNLLGDLDKTPPMYKGKTALAAAELYKAVADLNKAKVKQQLEIMEAKMKLAAFNKTKGSAQPAITGNTIIINREELIKQYGTTNGLDEPDEGDD